MRNEFTAICFIGAALASLFASAAIQLLALALWGAGVWYERCVGIYGE